MTPYYEKPPVTLWLGDCREVMAELPACSVDAIVTDPPYGIHFMQKSWDQFGSALGRDHQLGRERSGSMHAGEYDYSKNQQFQMWCESWAAEALRILKPGAIAVVFGSPRTYHRLASGIEDAGFEIRDCLQWLFGSGFPKSLNLHGEWEGWGTALKPAFEPVVLAVKPDTKWAIIGSCLSSLLVSIAAQLSPSSRSVYEQPSSALQRAGRLLNTLAVSSDLTDTWRSDKATALSLNIVSSWLGIWEELSSDGSTSTTVTRSSLTTELKTLSFLVSKLTPSIMLQAVKSNDGCPALVSSADALFNAVAQKLHATRSLSALGLVTEQGHISLPDEGALQPNYTAVVMARKPLVGTVASNVAAWGTGGINVDGCRIEGAGNVTFDRARDGRRDEYRTGTTANPTPSDKGRWPANVLLGHSDECWRLDDCECMGGHDSTKKHTYYLSCARDCPVRLLDAQSGERPGNSNENLTPSPMVGYGTYAERQMGGMGRNDGGGASRFFYTAKTSRAEREYGLSDLEPTRRSDGRDKDIENPRLRTNERRNDHPTVKPVDLMRWLCRLVTPPGGIVLDPFLGSGSTGMAALDEGFQFWGIDMEAHYLEIAKRRITRRHVIEPLPQADAGQAVLL